MNIISSYGVEIKKQNIPLRRTLEVYRSAVTWLIPVIEKEWDDLVQIEDVNKRFNTAEHLVHSTKGNRARYDFDSCYPKMPSYLRRSAIRQAIGTVSSYRSRMELWQKHELSGKPKLTTEKYDMPVFYRDNMYKEGEEGKDEAFLKLHNGHDWVWIKVKLLHTDMEYLRKNWSGVKASAPVLEVSHKKYFLRFAYKENVKLNKAAVQDQVICCVDLGNNTDAACSVMKADGTVLARKFINFASEKDRMYHSVGRIRRFQREHGYSQTESRWRYVNNLNGELSRKISGAIIDFAKTYRCNVIIFEYLEMKGKIRGSKKQKLHLWRKKEIQERCEHQAHRSGIRISHVNAWGTSALAFDGSGKVERDNSNHSLCTFTSGKQYNCDLSASYNIGARYFIRELIKPLSVMVRSLLEAKVPAVKRRSSCVYADLIALNRAMQSV